ncbi:MAG: SGNH/GDSL hydrolase family protein [Lachnospiraceae bacterium]|nr:SGNH/GDSL hydrolase family protein [Lachnospiraceae bacterium]
MDKIRWCAIGDSFTYLNDHLDETGYRVTKGYLSRILEKVPELTLMNIGVNGSTTEDWLAIPVPEADIYTILLGTNDWHWQRALGTEQDFTEKKAGTILGNLGALINRVYEANPQAKLLVLNPVERADFICILDTLNQAQGSYAPEAGVMLAEVADAIYTCAKHAGIPALDLHKECGFTQENVIHFKRLRKDGSYRNLPYPDYVGVAYNPEADEYPYPPEAVALTYDGLHPSDEGNEILAELIAKELKKLL